nr:unnamed protein product [Callosobruchus analis]
MCLERAEAGSYGGILSIEDRWQAIKEVSQSADKALGYREEKRKDWITDRTWDLIKQRKEKKCELNKGNTTTRRNQLIQEYNRLNKEIRNSDRHDKRKWVESIAERAEEAAATNNMEELYKSTKSLSRKCYATDIPLKSKSGELLTSAEDQIKRWNEYYQDLTGHDQNNEIADATTTNNIIYIDTSEPTREELKEAIKNMRINKSPGVDEIPSELWKADIEKTLDSILPLIKHIWIQEVLPTEWPNGIIIKIPKKGDRKDCCNWRGVTLLCSINKILASVMYQRIYSKVEEQLRNEQTFVNRCLRKILRIFWPNVITNRELWDRTNQTPIRTETKRRKWNWIGHTLRRGNEGITKQALKWSPTGRRSRGRPVETWKRRAEEELVSMGKTWKEASRLAKNKKEWKCFVEALCSARE